MLYFMLILLSFQGISYANGSLLGSIGTLVQNGQDGLTGVIAILDPGSRYQQVYDSNGVIQTADMYFKESDLAECLNFKPDTDIEYILHKRELNEGEILVNGDPNSITQSHFNASLPIKVEIHGWRGSQYTEFINKTTAAFLEAQECNVIVVDWSKGSSTLNYLVARWNTARTAEAVAHFLEFVFSVTGATPSQTHILGQSLGGQAAAMTGRVLNGTAAFVTGLDIAGPGFLLATDGFRETDGVCTQVFHTNGGGYGYYPPAGKVDVYFNKGTFMPGCEANIFGCSHERACEYHAESLNSNEFIARGCGKLDDVISESCSLSTTLVVGGLYPDCDYPGIYSLDTNDESPYAMGEAGIENV